MSSSGSAVKNLPAMRETQETQVGSLGGEDPLEEKMATHSSIHAWKFPWTEEPGGLQPWGCRVRQVQAEEEGGLCHQLLHQLHFQALPSFPAAPTHKEALKSFNPQNLGIQGASELEKFLVSPSLHISD